jgi:hypothetical protein
MGSDILGIGFWLEENVTSRQSRPTPWVKHH